MYLPYMSPDVYHGAPSEKIVIFIHAQAVKQSDGTFEPTVSAVKQQGREYTQVVLDQQAKRRAATAEEAILLGRKSASTALKEKFPEAEIKIK